MQALLVHSLLSLSVLEGDTPATGNQKGCNKWVSNRHSGNAMQQSCLGGPHAAGWHVSAAEWKLKQTEGAACLSYLPSPSHFLC